MKTKWLSLLGGLLGVAVVLGGCKKDDIGEGTFFPAAQISFHVPDSIITASDIYLNPVSGQPEITIKVRSPQGINRATLVTYKNNGDPLDLEIIDQEVKTFTLFRDTIYFTIPAGTVGIGDNSLVFEMQTEANHNALRTVRKGIIWHYGDGPVITFTDDITQLPAAFGTAAYELKCSFSSDVGLLSSSTCFLRGAFDDSDPDKLERFNSATNSSLGGALKRSHSYDIPVNDAIASATGFEITVTDVLPGTLARKTTVRIFREPVAAPSFESFPENLPANFADGAYPLTGTVKSDGGLVGIKIELLAGTYGSNGMPEITGTALDVATTTFPDPKNFDLARNIPADRTTGHFGIRITAIDRFLQESVKDIFIPNTLAAPPVVTLNGAKLPTVFSYTGAPLTGAVTTDTQLTSVVVNVLTGTFSSGTPNVTGRTAISTVSTFTNPQDYAIDLSAPATAGAIGIEVIAYDNQGLFTTETIYATDPAAMTVSTVAYASATGEARGLVNRNSNVCAWSLAGRNGFSTENVVLESTIGGVLYANYHTVDFMFWSSVDARESVDITNGDVVPYPASRRALYGIASPKAAQRLGTPSGKDQYGYSYLGYFSDGDTSWDYYNNTWFKVIGNTAVASADPNYINWSTFGAAQLYAAFAASDYAASFDATGNALLEADVNGGAGLKVGDVILVVTDVNKKAPAGQGKLAAIRVNAFHNQRAVDSGEWRSGETRLRFDLVMENE